MNYYAEGGQPYGLKSLAQELPKYGRGGDSIVAHINPEEAMMLKAMGGSGTINPVTGLPEYSFFKKAAQVVRKPIQAITKGATDAVKTVQNIPGIKQVSDIATQAVKPIDQALVGLDKTVGKAIPGGWGTVASVAGSAMGIPTPYLVGLGALNGSGVTRKGGSFNLQGALIGGATAYAAAELGDYARAAAPGAGAGPELLAGGGDDVIAGLGGSTGAAVIPESAMPQLLNAMPPPPPSIGSQIMAGNFGDAISQAGSNISTAASNAYTSAGEGLKSLGTKATDAFNTAVNPSTYTNAIENAGTNLSQTGAGIKNLVTGPAGVSKAASALSGVNPVTMGGAAIFGASSLADLDAQRDFLNQQKAAGNIAQAEYDQALAEINRQADFARETVNKSPFSTTPDRDVSIGETFYGRGGSEDTLYGRGDAGTTLYAMGGSVDDESGMDEARGMMQGNLQKGLFGKGYAAGGQVDMGNGYNPFANLPSMGGALGAVRQDMTTFDPNFNKPNFDAARNLINSTNTTTEQDMMGGNRNGISGGLSSIFSGFGGGMPLGSSTANATPQPLGGLNQQVPTGPIFNSSTYQSTGMGPNSGASSSTYPGGYGGGGGSGGAFPLEGQYGIVKMAAGGMTPRFLSGGGDGMSDDIPATINGDQPARLADGEFVIPADVVSHIGNGSSKAGAKQLYSMMNKVRKARTGNPKQGKQINPSKYLPA